MPSSRERMRELARLGGLAKAAQRRAARVVQPFAGSVLDAMDVAGLTGPSWAAWRVLVKASFGLPLEPAELVTYQEHTGRMTAPTTPAREVYAIVGRRGGKTRVASVVAMWTAASRDYHQILAPGEQAIVPLLAADKRQAQQALGYVRGLAQLPAFAPLIAKSLKWTIELRTACTLEVKTASYRLVRGFSVPAICADELAFWQATEDSANPDSEVLGALRPAMANMSGAMLWGLSTPYSKTGALWEAYDAHYGREGSDTLVWVAPSLAMNSSLDARIVERALEDDPEANAAEYLAQFRSDIANFITPEALAAVTNAGRPLELDRREGVAYRAFADPSGGASDAFSLAIAHLEGTQAVLDWCREHRPPFSPDAVVEEYAAVLKSYGLSDVTGDHYSAQWSVERFAQHGITYKHSDRPKSQLYLELLGPLNARRIELPDQKRLRAQLLGLERRTSRAGKDQVDHRAGGKDDLANSAAGALVLALERKAIALVGPAMVEGPPRWDCSQFSEGGDAPQYRSAMDYPVARRGRFAF